MQQESYPFKLVLFAAIPTAIYVLISAFLTFPATRKLGYLILEENGPVELASFAMMTLAGVLGLLLVRRERSRMNRWAFIGFLFCSLVFVIIGMEEVSWGQQFFGFETPEAIKRSNFQHEMTLHNNHFLQNHLEILAVIFSLAGMAGVAMGLMGVNKQLMPQPIFFFWLAPLLIVSSLDLMHDFWIPWHAFDMLINALDEVNEMHCALFALTFIHLKSRELRGDFAP